MALIPFKIQSVFGGWSPSQYFGEDGQFLSSIGIDPDFPIDDSAIKTSGLIRPTALAKFSGSTVTGSPLWIVTNPKTTNTYVYATDGKVHTVTSALAMGSDLTTPASGAGNGAAYYDNYIYFATTTDIARYGPLDGSPTLTQNYWTSTLSKSALNNTTYPTLQGVVMPNHVMHRHTDNKLYFADVLTAAGGSAATKNEGIIHFIKTSQTTVEGDTNAGSTYNAINFPFGYFPTAIESYGTDLAVAFIEGTDTTIKQKRAKVAFWDTTSVSYQKITDVEFPDPIISAMKNVNGVLYVWSGNASGGVRLSYFAGGYSFKEIAYFEEGTPPLAGAADHEMSKVLWGGWMTNPEAFAVVMSYGSKKTNIPMGIHCPFKSTSSGSTQQVTAVKYLEQANNSRLRPIIGWRDASAKGLDKISTTYSTNVFRSEVYRVGQPGIIKKLRIPLAQAVGANMTLTAKIYIDDESSTSTLTVVNNSNYPNSERNIVFYPDVSFKHNFYIELRWTGTSLLTVNLPISGLIETMED